MKGSTIKLIIYILLTVVGLSIYQVNHDGKSPRGYFEPLYSSLHTSGASINRTLIMAHRGSRYIVPENTILAFQTALDLGTDVIETDVRLSKDGHLVIFHDKLLDRVTNINGDVEDHTLAELRACDAGYRFSPDNGTSTPFRGRGLKVPTMREVFETLPTTTSLNIEIKEDDIKVAESLWRELERAFKELGRPHRSVVVSCRFCEPTAHIRVLAREYMVKNGLSEMPITTSGCEREVTRFVILSQIYLAKLVYSVFPITSFEVFQVPTSSGPISLETGRFIDTAHYFGLHVHFWVINDAPEMKRVLGLGIEAIITDRPDIAIKVFKDAKLKPANFPVPKPLPSNHSGTYFIPLSDVEESHTCISFFCILLQRIHFIILALVLSFVFMKLYSAKSYIAAKSGLAKRKKNYILQKQQQQQSQQKKKTK
ncbi:hypothetical protein DFA_11981 [Cavenderia fasciculata]|uniref:GP-PDE domain-containing protein n=1 Tax=Cavenderia fasciculata TaxID=261658 RepID=F4QF58_CACFS|nr:uncharacterized protein DFA_11981 [Cavenderia fasciculata]EGG14212.1 hypothetical protein DFA_11981 [Cavenderia fasciculata]|eukprot:XP_004350920.1 hypothetical protein DFA_11981 [Cavenderia fasciculata]